MSTRISRVPPYRLAVAASGSAEVGSRPVVSGPRMANDIDDHTLARLITAEIRAAFTHATIAQLAYDMGQVERGDQAFSRAQEACESARTAGRSLSEAGWELVCGQLEALNPALEACKHQRSDFHATLRQPSLS